MTPQLDIDRLVREVLAELSQKAASDTSAIPNASTSPTVGQVCNLSESRSNPTKNEPIENSKPASPSLPVSLPKREESTLRELTFSGRLMTLSEVSGKLAGVRRLVVRPGTIITPAVKDEIRQRNIQVVFDAIEVASAPLRLVILAARTRIDSKALAAALRIDGVDVELHTSKCLIAATERLAAEVGRRNTLGLLITPHESEAICLANRLSGVRAISGREANQIAADATAVGANVLIINPKRSGAYEIRKMSGEFCRGGLRPCPDALKNQLA